MELEIDRSQLLQSLNYTYNIADRKSSMPILSNIFLSTEKKDRVQLCSTDLYIGVRHLTSAKIIHQGSITVPSRTFFSIIKNLPEGKVQLSTDEKNFLVIESGKIHYKIAGISGDDFPPLPNPGQSSFHVLSAEAMATLISHTHFSMSNDNTRPHLSGAFFEGDGKILRMVTTDGHRLSKMEVKLEDSSELLNFSMLVPQKGILELRKLLEDIKASNKEGKNKESNATIQIATDGKHLFVQTEDLMMSINLSSENFPPYEKVIPKHHERSLEIQRLPLIESLRRISLLSSDKSGSLKFEISENKLSIKSENSEVGEGSEELEVAYSGDSLTIGFNAKYVLDTLGALVDDDIVIELSGELDPCVLRPLENPHFVGVIMPIRI